MINILFAGNDKVFDGIMTCLLSILKRSNDPALNVYIYTMNLTEVKPEYTAISEEKAGFLDSLVKRYNKESSVRAVDVTGYYKKYFGGGPNEGAYCTPYTLLRLLADVVPDMPEKLLYLDADLMFNRGIELLYDIDVEGYEYAAARDHYGKYLVNPNFINAGVLLLNMKEIGNTGLFVKSRDLLARKKLLFADESAIWRCSSKKKMLPQKFNDQKFLHKSTVVRHFSKRLFYLPYPHTDNIKPWMVTKVHRIFGYDEFDDCLYEYIYLKRAFEDGSIK